MSHPDYTLTRAQLVYALRTASDSWAFGPDDGTYELIPTWIGRDRVWMAQKITHTTGFEVGMRPAVGDWDHDTLQYQVHARYGVWTSPTGALCIDRVVHVEGTVNDALEIADTYGQEAIWDWALGEAVPVIRMSSAAIDEI